MKHSLTRLTGTKKVVVNGMILMSDELDFTGQKHEIRGNNDQSGWTVSDATAGANTAMVTMAKLQHTCLTFTIIVSCIYATAPSFMHPTGSKPQFQIRSSPLTTIKSSSSQYLPFADSSSPETQAALLSPHSATYIPRLSTLPPAPSLLLSPHYEPSLSLCCNTYSTTLSSNVLDIAQTLFSARSIMYKTTLELHHTSVNCFMSFSHCHFAARSILSFASAPQSTSTKLQCSSSPHHTHTSAQHVSSPTPQTSSPSILPHSPLTLRSQHSKTPTQRYASFSFPLFPLFPSSSPSSSSSSSSFTSSVRLPSVPSAPAAHSSHPEIFPQRIAAISPSFPQHSPNLQVQEFQYSISLSSLSPSSQSSTSSSLFSSSSSPSPSSSSSLSSSISAFPLFAVCAFASVSTTTVIFPVPSITQTTTSIARTHSSTAHRSEISTSNTPFSVTFALATLRSFFDDTSSSVSASLLAPTIVLGGSSTASIASSSSSSFSSSSLSDFSNISRFLLFLCSSFFLSAHPADVHIHLAWPCTHPTASAFISVSVSISIFLLTQASSPSHQSHLAHPGSLQQSTAVAAPTTSSDLPAAVTSSVIISTTSSSSLSSALSAPLSFSAADAPPLLLGTYSPSSHISSHKRFFYSPPRLFKSTTPLDDVPPLMPSSHSLRKRSSSSHQEIMLSMELRKYRKANETRNINGQLVRTHAFDILFKTNASRDVCAEADEKRKDEECDR
ncbi:uncharacterized protein MONOS_15842 [Monocercomonoides exilis]|uniref:uncharacterized protein n=1 Tax=Monocercomonoides exilis TaxID=2049356 RepID=UPI00355ABA90|nr:hypothetical protein MONOS_15842 [Monocercomonoides exilis]|eukprot:MONOS_15842.1-p1 / transcript=MONOS_15842.1 / gene=MONOS_15842 / organism=Monocercomonoides_exilis_PA203 / gene_product=unspecified product / transcript_product=unspecified product / location=Mono_scaffold01375:7549-10002(+) / protein_length=726 / sequence_SO=supercontig / SO=protein_coding / is_pseudo=false